MRANDNKYIEGLKRAIDLIECEFEIAEELQIEGGNIAVVKYHMYNSIQLINDEIQMNGGKRYE